MRAAISPATRPTARHVCVPTKGAAQWVVSPASGYEKLGISIANAQNDYFNLTLVYKNIREAVDILNPAPKN